MDRQGQDKINRTNRLNSLQKEFLRVSKELAKAKRKARRRDLKEHLDELKVELGWVYLECREHDMGLSLYDSLSWRTHGETKCNGMARALTEMGHYDEAGRILKAGLRRYPESYTLWVARGALSDSLGDDFETLKCMETALRFAPDDNSGALYNKALVLMRLGCYGDARPIVEELIERYPRDPKYLAEMGVLALETGYPREALQFYQRAMEVWEKAPGIYEGICIYSGLCCTLMEMGMKREGMEVALDGLRRFPDEDPVFYQNVGATFYEMGWKNECMEVLKKGIGKFPKDKALREFLSEVEGETDDPDSGEKTPSLGFLLLLTLLCKKMRKK